MSSKLNGKRAVVTGAGSGLGRAFAVELAKRGANLVLGDISSAGLDETAKQVSAAAPAVRVVTTQCDVTRAEAVEALASLAERELGGVDLVVNNAGVAVAGPVGEVPLENWRHVVDVNLWGVIHGCHVFVPRFRKQGSGWVVNVASAAGLISAPKMAPYNVTKAAVVALSETLRAELDGTGVNVTVLCPTFFRTGILDNSRGSDSSQREMVNKRMDASKIQAPEVARAALDAAEAGTLYAVPMWDGWVFWRLKRFAPELFPRLAARAERFLR